MRIRTLVAPVALLLSVASFQASSEPISAAQGWNSSVGHLSAYEKSVALTRADLIEKAEGGFYDGFNSYYYSISSVTAGNIVTFNGEVGSGVEIISMNCGHVASIDALNTAGTQKANVEGDTCTLGEYK